MSGCVSEHPGPGLFSLTFLGCRFRAKAQCAGKWKMAYLPEAGSSGPSSSKAQGLPQLASLREYSKQKPQVSLGLICRLKDNI